jgi:hypothetical protein
MSDSETAVVSVVPKKRGRPPKKQGDVSQAIASAVLSAAAHAMKKTQSGRIRQPVARLSPVVQKKTAVGRKKTEKKARSPAKKAQPRIVQSAAEGEIKFITDITVRAGQTLVVKDGGGQLTIKSLVLEKGATFIDDSKASSLVKIESIDRKHGSVVVTNY